MAVISTSSIAGYFDTLAKLLHDAEATQVRNVSVPLETAFSRIIDKAQTAHAMGQKVIFVGNGGSAAIASHLAIDYAKNGNIRAIALNDGAALTCLGNDFGYDQVFAKQIEMQGAAGDILVAISSSGRSDNILNAVRAARQHRMYVVTLSGFAPDNPLRGLGDMNLYINSPAYGFVEVGHLALCHAILDLATENGSP